MTTDIKLNYSSDAGPANIKRPTPSDQLRIGHRPDAPGAVTPEEHARAERARFLDLRRQEEADPRLHAGRIRDAERELRRLDGSLAELSARYGMQRSQIERAHSEQVARLARLLASVPAVTG